MTTKTTHRKNNSNNDTLSSSSSITTTSNDEINHKNESSSCINHHEEINPIPSSIISHPFLQHNTNNDGSSSRPQPPPSSLALPIGNGNDLYQLTIRLYKIRNLHHLFPTTASNNTLIDCCWLSYQLFGVVIQTDKFTLSSSSSSSSSSSTAPQFPSVTDAFRFKGCQSEMEHHFCNLEDPLTIHVCTVGSVVGRVMVDWRVLFGARNNDKGESDDSVVVKGYYRVHRDEEDDNATTTSRILSPRVTKKQRGSDPCIGIIMKWQRKKEWSNDNNGDDDTTAVASMSVASSSMASSCTTSTMAETESSEVIVTEEEEVREESRQRHCGHDDGISVLSDDVVNASSPCLQRQVTTTRGGDGMMKIDDSRHTPCVSVVNNVIDEESIHDDCAGKPASSTRDNTKSTPQRPPPPSSPHPPPPTNNPPQPTPPTPKPHTPPPLSPTLQLRHHEWETWRHNAELQFHAQLRQKEAAAIRAIQHRATLADAERLATLDAAKKNYLRLESRLKKALSEAERRSRDASLRDEDRQREHKRTLSDLEHKKKVWRDEASHAITMERAKIKALSEELDHVTATAARERDRALQSQRELDDCRARYQKSREAALERDVAVLKAELAGCEANVRKERVATAEALMERDKARAQVVKLGRLLKRERERRDVRGLKDAERVRLECKVREQREVLGEDREELKRIKEELSQIQSMGVGTSSVMPVMPQQQTFCATGMLSPGGWSSSIPTTMTPTIPRAPHMVPPPQDVYPSPHHPTSNNEMTTGINHPPSCPGDNDTAANRDNNNNNNNDSNNNEIKRLQQEKNDLLATGVYDINHPIIVELDRLIQRQSLSSSSSS